LVPAAWQWFSKCKLVFGLASVGFFSAACTPEHCCLNSNYCLGVEGQYWLNISQLSYCAVLGGALGLLPDGILRAVPWLLEISFFLLLPWLLLVLRMHLTSGVAVKRRLHDLGALLHCRA
jgi:hypothetical protein